MNWETYLDELYHSGITLWPDGNDLVVEGLPEALTPAHLQTLKTHKHELLHFLRHATTHYPLSSGQQGLWFEHQMMPDGFAYNVSLPLRIHSVVEPTTLEQAFQLLVNRHPALRTTFPLSEGQPIQQVHRYQEVILKQVDASLWTEQELKERVRATHERPFDLAQGPLFRLSLFTRQANDHVLLFTLHHLISDGWSNWLMLDELRTLFPAVLADEPAELPALQSTYRDYVAWEARILKEKEEQLWDYWKSRLAGELPLLNLPTDQPRSAVRTYQGASLPLLIPNNLTRAVTALAQRSGATLYMVLLAAFQILLHRYTGQNDILVGSPIVGQRRPEFASIVGYFVNPVVMRADLSANLYPQGMMLEEYPCGASFREYLGQVRQTVLGALEHQDFPFPLLVQRLQPPRAPGMPTVFQSSFTLISAQTDAQLIELTTGATTEPVDFGGLQVSSFPLSQYDGQFDLFLELFDTPTALRGALKYNPDLFDKTTIERMAGHFQTLLEGIVANPQQPISDLPILTQAERHQLLVEWNDTATMTANKGLCVHQLFEEQVTRTPDAIAVIFGSGQLTYRELNERANQLAHYLIAQGVEPDMLVGICVEPSIEMVVGILGIIKAGGAYVPLDPAYPNERLQLMVKKARINLILTQKRFVATLSSEGISLYCLDADKDNLSEYSKKNPQTTIAANNLLYMIYTSGSTGNPKGAGVYHTGFTNLLNWFTTSFRLDANDSVLLISSLSFDLTQKNIFAPLLVGGCLHLIKEYDPREIADLIFQHKITWINCTPSAFYPIVEWANEPSFRRLHSLRYLFLGGEPITISRLENWMHCENFNAKIVNTYGPTECTDICASYVIQPDLTGDVVPIGRPINNVQLFILDQNQRLVPRGHIGELYIGGVGVGAGYIGDRQTSLMKFIPNPFQNEFEKGMIYKTGDLCRYLPQSDDGVPNIEYIGRIDNQVKIRGFRIELGEIEANLRQHVGVREAVVVVREEGVPSRPGKQLVAYVVSSTGSAHRIEDDLADETETTSVELLSRSLRAYLSQKLPDYMIPSAFVRLDALPLTPNSKIDRRALPSPTWVSQTTYVAPQNEVERQIVALWQEVLQIEQAAPEQYNISVHDNFFELGGHSLLIIQLHHRLREIYEQEDGSVSIAVTDLFKYPTVHTLARHVSQQLYTSPKLTLAQQAAISAKKTFEPMVESRKFCDTPIAIIGISCRFPDANGVDTFWENLRQGKESISFFSDEDCLASGVDPSLVSDPHYVKAGTVLPDIKLFDATFFGFSPREAEVLDPQHRLFLECTWEAIESAGYSQDQASIGLYAGVGVSSYLRHNLYPNRELVESIGDYQLLLNTDKDFLPTRVSYKLNLTGPSVNVQTACSTSLVAVHLACQSLLNGECDIALAGGASVQVPQKSGYLYKEGMIASPDGHCRAFDAQACGTVGGNGVGIVVLKRFTSAIEDGDTIHAVIKGSAINNDGSLKVSYTAPSVEGQAKAIRDAQAVAGVAPETITYIEAHGTGTVLGDPIEIAALTQAFQERSERNGGNNPNSELRNPQFFLVCHWFRQKQYRPCGYGGWCGRVD